MSGADPSGVPDLLIIMNAFGMIFVVYIYRKLGLGDVGGEQV